ncbi:ferric reductase like transmembrane component [Colletotrichum acutatum]
MAAGGATKSPEEQQAAIDAANENVSLSNYLYYICAAIAAAVIIWRVWTVIVRYVRTVACLNNDNQRYFAQSDSKVSWMKKNILYAPVMSKRHNREIQLSSAINVGTLPSRLQLLFLTGYFATNIAFCVINIPFAGSFAAAASQLRNRTGTLAVVNMIPLFLMGGRNNPLIPMLGMSFDTFNLLHRWFGRIVILEALAHTLAWMANTANKSSWQAAITSATTVPFLLFGFVATCAFVAIGIQASSPIRHAFYETFKFLHILLAITAVVGTWYHLQMKALPQLKYMWPVIIFWGGDRVWRAWRVFYGNVGHGGSKALVEALPGNACRVTVTMARPWTFGPGQHAYMYMPSLSLLQSHPFSVAWSEEAEDPMAEKGSLNRQDILAMRKTTMSFIIRARTGMTDTLYRKAAACPEGKMTTTCMVEGPYGGLHSMRSYGTVMLFAGGVGITHQVPHVRDLVAGYANGTVAARKVILIWTIQSPEHLEWIRPWMTEILAMEKRRDVLRIMLFVSRPRSTKEIHSPSSTVQMFPGRPNIETLIKAEQESQVGTMGISVCGPGALSDEVRRAVRDRQHDSAIDFNEEAFSCGESRARYVTETQPTLTYLQLPAAIEWQGFTTRHNRSVSHRILPAQKEALHNMGLAYNTYLNSNKVYGCKTCKAHLSNHEDIISRNFRGQHGKAYLFNSVVNIETGEPSERNMTTGRHIVRDITCKQCKETVGWKYDKAYEATEKYKEGKFILEAELLCNVT